MMHHHPSVATLRALRTKCLGIFVLLLGSASINAQTPTVTDSNLQVTTVISAGLAQPLCMAFLGNNDFFVTEKASGQVKRVVNGTVVATVLDLPVNSNSERGLLGIALHPNFPANPSVYLYWSESSTGVDTTDVKLIGNPNSIYPPGTPQPLGNRVDRFTWNSTNQTLNFAANVIVLRGLQHDGNNANPQTAPPTPAAMALDASYQGNHNAGQIRFGPDGKLYVQIGDNGRRGWLQNLPNGPYLPVTNPVQSDDQFGGPQPDNSHVTGVIFRLNDDGSTPTDNPFFAPGAAMGGEVGGNIQKLFSYGHRNGFGLAFDPFSGSLWESENGDDAFDEINKVVPGGNYGWVQFAGPISRMLQWKTIEMNLFTPGANSAVGINQQLRYPVTRAAYNGATALTRMFALPGAAYQDPEFSWLYAVPPAGLGFVNGNGLGLNYNGTLWSGAARTTNIINGTTGTFAGGFLMCFKLTADRSHLDLSADARLTDRVADNGNQYPPPFGTPAGTAGYKFDGRESESLLIGQNFGVAGDIQTGPDGGLYVVSNTKNAVYKISLKPAP